MPPKTNNPINRTNKPWRMRASNQPRLINTWIMSLLKSARTTCTTRSSTSRTNRLTDPAAAVVHYLAGMYKRKQQANQMARNYNSFQSTFGKNLATLPDGRTAYRDDQGQIRFVEGNGYRNSPNTAPHPQRTTTNPDGTFRSTTTSQKVETTAERQQRELRALDGFVPKRQQGGRSNPR